MAGSKRALVERIDVIDVEDDAPPPGPALFIVRHNQVEIATSCAKAGERGRFATVQDFEPKRRIEPHGATHVVGGKRDCADAFDHGDAFLESKSTQSESVAIDPDRSRPTRTLLRWLWLALTLS